MTRVGPSVAGGDQVWLRYSVRGERFWGGTIHGVTAQQTHELTIGTKDGRVTWSRECHTSTWPSRTRKGCGSAWRHKTVSWSLILSLALLVGGESFLSVYNLYLVPTEWKNELMKYQQRRSYTRTRISIWRTLFEHSLWTKCMLTNCACVDGWS